MFGGNFMRLQKYLSSSGLGKALESLGPGMKRWTDCTAEHNDVKMVGSVSFAQGADLRFVMTGFSVDDLEKCAKAAQFTTTVDPDRKFIAIEAAGATGRATKLGYLSVPGGMYARTSIKPALGTSTSPDRATLEADVAAAGKANVTQNSTLQAMIAKIDRTKPMWLAGNVGNTPIGDKVSEVFGSLDYGDGALELDVSAEFKDGKLADQIVSKFEDVKDMGGVLGPDVKDVLNHVKLTKDGARLRLVVKVTDAQLSSLASKIPLGALGRSPQ